MSIANGFNSWVAAVVESVYGTAPAMTNAKYLEVNKDTVKLKKNRISKPALNSVTQRRGIPSKQSVEGGWEFQFPVNGAELWLKYALGSNVTSGAGPYLHTITPSKDITTGLTLHCNRDAAAIGNAFQYTGCQVSKLTLKQEIEDELMCSLEYLGQQEALVSVATPTFATFIGFDWTHFSATINSVAVDAESAELTIDNGLAADIYKLGQLYRKRINRGSNRKVSGKIGIEFESLTQYNLFVNQTSHTIVLSWIIDANQKLVITLNGCYLTGETPEVTEAGPVKLSLPFECIHGTEGGEISIALTNAVATIP
jgi:hypothetical protein